MARGEAEMASASGAMRDETALQTPKWHEFEPPAQGHYWMARDGYLFSVALDRIGDEAQPDLPLIHRATKVPGAPLRHSRPME
jgi:hypothetical protein